MDRILIERPGHRYTIKNLDGEGSQTIQFVQRQPHHNPLEGILIQDLLRILIDRLRVLDHEQRWPDNDASIHDLRVVLARQEARALIEHTKRGNLPHLEYAETDPRNGHLKFESL